MMILIFAALAALVLVWGISTYNRLVTERLKVHTQWSQVDVVLKQRFDLIPSLVEAVKGYAAHENRALQAVLDARSGYLGAPDAEGRRKAGAELSGCLGQLLAVAEAYPELKANQNFLQLQQQITEVEEKLADYRQFYNDTVLRYNSQLVTIPANLIAGLFHFEAEPFFLVSQEERSSLEIRF